MSEGVVPVQPSFLHLLAHDMRTPLGGLSAALDVMSYGAQLPAEDVSEALAIAKRQVGRLSQTIEILEILDLLARPPVKQASISLDLVLLEAWNRSRMDAALTPRALALPDCKVVADDQMLLQLLHALLRYGLRFHPCDAPQVNKDESRVTVMFAAPDAAPPFTKNLPLMLQAAQALAALAGAGLLFHGSPESPGFRLQLETHGRN